ncbi:MAG: ornithine carbamoyltransferase [Deltaproteobacteria bacterium]|nr:ornithine carbamoyltransferase [Deltaproteobacteria bacterium]
MPRHFLKLTDFSLSELEALLKEAIRLKQDWKKGKTSKPLSNKTLAMVFEKSSTRTRVSFELACVQLGGHALSLSTSSSQLGRGETYEDTARVLSRYADAIMLRTFDHDNLEAMAKVASVPVINGLTDLFHPVQILADLQTILEKRSSLKDMTLAYVGDGNNLANSWIHAASLFGFELRVSCPQTFHPHESMVELALSKKNIHFEKDPKKALKGAHVVYTDTWFSMGQEVDKAKKRIFAPYQLNDFLLKNADPKVGVMHCLPAHRGEEITDEVIDGKHSWVWDQAENRLHAQKALLLALMKDH